MKFCRRHDQMCLDAVELNGMTELLDDVYRVQCWQPMEALFNHFAESAKCCGLDYLNGMHGVGINDGHYCPLCELEKSPDEFHTKMVVGIIACQMGQWARRNGILPLVS